MPDGYLQEHVREIANLTDLVSTGNMDMSMKSPKWAEMAEASKLIAKSQIEEHGESL